VEALPVGRSGAGRAPGTG